MDRTRTFTTTWRERATFCCSMNFSTADTIAGVSVTVTVPSAEATTIFPAGVSMAFTESSMPFHTERPVKFTPEFCWDDEACDDPLLPVVPLPPELLVVPTFASMLVSPGNAERRNVLEM